MGAGASSCGRAVPGAGPAGRAKAAAGPSTARGIRSHAKERSVFSSPRQCLQLTHEQDEYGLGAPVIAASGDAVKDRDSSVKNVSAANGGQTQKAMKKHGRM